MDLHPQLCGVLQYTLNEIHLRECESLAAFYRSIVEILLRAFMSSGIDERKASISANYIRGVMWFVRNNESYD